MIIEKTESTITKLKVPAIKAMGWNARDQFLIYTNHGEVHRLPSAAVKQTIDA